MTEQTLPLATHALSLLDSQGLPAMEEYLRDKQASRQPQATNPCAGVLYDNSILLYDDFHLLFGWPANALWHTERRPKPMDAHPPPDQTPYLSPMFTWPTIEDAIHRATSRMEHATADALIHAGLLDPGSLPPPDSEKPLVSAQAILSLHPELADATRRYMHIATQNDTALSILDQIEQHVADDLEHYLSGSPAGATLERLLKNALLDALTPQETQAK